MAFVGVALAVVWIGVVSVGVGWVSLRLRRRAIRRGTYPFRNLPWYLGGTPEMPLDPPNERHVSRRKRR